MEAAALECPSSSSEKRYFPESLDSSDGDEEGILACEDLELNPFDGLPYSSRYYKLLKEREDLPIWKEKYSFMEKLLQSQIVIVSGDAKCGKSSQVSGPCRKQSALYVVQIITASQRGVRVRAVLSELKTEQKATLAAQVHQISYLTRLPL